jgi:hypothetical protein
MGFSHPSVRAVDLQTGLVADLTCLSAKALDQPNRIPSGGRTGAA